MFNRFLALVGILILPRWRQRQYVFYVFIIPLIVFLVSMFERHVPPHEVLHIGLRIALIGVIIGALYNGIRIFGLGPTYHGILQTLPISQSRIFLTRSLSILIDAQLSMTIVLFAAFLGWQISISLSLLWPYESVVLSMTIVMIALGVIIARLARTSSAAIAWARIATFSIFILGGGGYVSSAVFPPFIATLQRYLPTGIMLAEINSIVRGSGIEATDVVIMGLWQVVLVGAAISLPTKHRT